MADRLWKRAEHDLRVQVIPTRVDLIVWEHSCRVARLAEAVAALPEVAGESVDHLALTAAALYHDMGWVLQVRAGALEALQLLLKPTSDVQFELAADWVLANLGNILPGGSLELAARAIRSANNHDTDIVETQILTEADNLDQIGPQAIALMIRKQQAEGRTLADLVAAWQRQEEYHYWQARIKECFRFPSVRAMAERRWQALRRFMIDLREAVELEDAAVQLHAAADNDRP